MEILVGCSGYSYSGWRGKFYPSDLPRYRFIEYYEQHFPAVELNFTFYKLDNARKTIRDIIRRTSRLKLAVKLNRVFTHRRNYTEKDVSQFMDAVEPALESNRLPAVLAQFPSTFVKSDENMDYLHRLADELNGLKIAVEFRSDSWLDEETLNRVVEKDNLAIVNVDAPPIEGLFVGPWKTFGSFNYVRLHGRNKEGWEDYKTRYLYDYSDEELQEIARKIKNLEPLTTLVFFNNTPQGNAPKNALRLMELLNQ